jgi:hypothetical protein
MQADHITPLDAFTVAQVARTEALIEVIETELAKVSTRNGRRMKWLAELELRAINRQTELLRELGMTRRSRAGWLGTWRPASRSPRAFSAAVRNESEPGRSRRTPRELRRAAGRARGDRGRRSRRDGGRPPPRPSRL